MQLIEIGDSVAGKKLIAVGRDIGRVAVIAGTSDHRAQRIDIRGKPAKCFIDIPLKAVE
ncbi:MAG: hypothetical protein V1911_03460 [Candidatus Micrarchaeota archaeon]